MILVHKRKRSNVTSGGACALARPRKAIALASLGRFHEPPASHRFSPLCRFASLTVSLWRFRAVSSLRSLWLPPVPAGGVVPCRYRGTARAPRRPSPGALAYRRVRLAPSACGPLPAGVTNMAAASPPPCRFATSRLQSPIMTKPTSMQTVAALAIALCAYFSKYEFESIKDEQKQQRQALQNLSTTTAENRQLLEQVVRNQPIKLPNYQPR